MQRKGLQEPQTVPRTSVVRRDVPWHAVPHSSERIRSAANGSRKARPIASMEEGRDWERLFIGELKAGRDPRRPRTPRRPTDVAPKDVAAFLDAYVERCAKPAGLKSEKSLCSRVAVLKKYL